MNSKKLIKFDKFIFEAADDNHKRNKHLRLAKVAQNHPVITLIKKKKTKAKKIT